MQYLLSYLIFLPILTAIVALLIPAVYRNVFRILALCVSLIQLLLMVLVLQFYSTKETSFQLIEKASWITIDLGSWGIFKAEYLVGLDGLSLIMVLLSVLILFIAVLSSWNTEKDVKGYFILLLILNGAILGSFCAMDLLLFYLFFEFMLLPMYFLIGIWGGPRREYASIKFFLYTLFGSILILVVIIGLYSSVKEPGPAIQVVHTFNMEYMKDSGNYISESVLNYSSPWIIGPWSARLWAFFFLFIGFTIKLPMVPLHTWLPDAHVEAPTAISVVLAALLLKIGGYGLARLAFPVFPDGAVYFSWVVGLMGLISIIYGGLNALASKDLKRLIAYSSVSHMGFVLLGLASMTIEGISGAVYQMFSHGILSAMLFLLVGVIYDRTNNRMIENYSGLSSVMKKYTVFVIIAFFASMGLPGFSGFIAEVMILFGAFKSNSLNTLLPEWMAVTATLGLILAAAYYLWTIQRMFFGPLSIKVQGDLRDLDYREYIMLIPLAFMALLFGVFPQLLLNIINPFSHELANTINHLIKIH